MDSEDSQVQYLIISFSFSWGSFAVDASLNFSPSLEIGVSILVQHLLVLGDLPISVDEINQSQDNGVVGLKILT